ncbi:sensor domain-containing protein [Streptomyces sp. NPDC002577]
MSSQPPSGPPRGPLPPRPGPPGPEKGPEPGGAPAGGPPRRLLTLVVGGAVVVLGLVVLLITLLRGGGEGGGPPKASASPTSTDTAAARELAKRAALTPGDWGPGFEKDDPYEIDPADEFALKADCEAYARTPRTGTLASVNRAARTSSRHLAVESAVWVFADQPTAEKFIADTRTDLHRCPTQTSGKGRWTGIHEGNPPQLTGFDDVVSEEGTVASHTDGTKAHDPYIILTGRAGETVLIAKVYATPDSATEIRKQAANGLQLMEQLRQGAGG